MNTVIQVDRISKRYRLGVTRTSLLRTLSNSFDLVLNPALRKQRKKRDFWALRDVSFKMAPGDALALIGPNGAGKSTILKLLANITRPTEGTIDIEGRVSALIELGSGFHGDLTGRENIYLNGTILGLSRKEISRSFDEIVDFSELEQFIDTPVKRYSSGMLVRLGFAVASCMQPEILLVDEVLAVGDASFREKCLNRIHSLVDSSTIIIFVSHNLYMVKALCPSALYIDHGRVKFQGKTEQAISAYERDLNEEKARNFEESRSEEVSEPSDVQIEEVEVLNAEGLSTAQFRSDQPAEICVQYKAHRSREAANAVVRIVRSDGITCCMMRTTLDNVQLSLQEGENHFSIVLSPLQLNGGSYFVDARIINASDTVVMAHGWSKKFFVSGLALSHEEESGVFEPKRVWKT